jgi:hypothetical protein
MNGAALISSHILRTKLETRNMTDVQADQPLPPAQPAYLSTKDAALYIRTAYGYPCTSGSLSKMRLTGKGPMFRLFGSRPIYAPAEIDAWARSRIGPPVHSTSAYIPNTPKRTGRPPKYKVTFAADVPALRGAR